MRCRAVAAGLDLSDIGLPAGLSKDLVVISVGYGIPLLAVYLIDEANHEPGADVRMTPQPHEIRRVPVGSERPARVHVIWHNRKFAGYTVRLDTGQDKWAALSPYGALVGETSTHIEALSLLAPDAEIAPKKTSVYLDGATAAAVRKSGQPLAELIRKGLAASPTTE